MDCIDNIPLPNGLTVEVYDLSRQIAANTTKVELLIRIEIKLNEAYFSNQEQYDLTRKVLGNELFFEYRMERTFVKNAEKDIILRELLAAFKKDSISYLSHPDFARRFVLSQYRKMNQRPGFTIH